MDTGLIDGSGYNISKAIKRSWDTAVLLMVLFIGLGLWPAPTLAQKPDVNTLIKSLKHQNPNVRQKAARDLGRIGPSARPAVPALIAALGDGNRSVHKEAMLALKNIGKPAVPALIQALKNPNPDVREGAALSLGKIGPGAEPAIPALIRALLDKNGSVKKSAEYSLRRMGNPAAAALKKTRDTDSGPLGRAAEKVLKKMDAKSY